MKKASLIVLALIVACLWTSSLSAQCSKEVDDNGVIAETLQAYFKASAVGGEPGAIVDWCYWWGHRRGLFLFLMRPVASKAQAKAMMEEIGLAILKAARARQDQGQALSRFEANVLKHGLKISMMVQGMPEVGFPAFVYLNPSVLSSE